MAGQRFALPTGNAVSHYGPRDFEDKLPAQYASSQGDKTVSIQWAYDDLPVQSATDQSVLSIPAASFIVSATLRVHTAFAGGTSYNIGLYESDGTVIDADGIDAAVATAAINAAGETVLCDGALVQGLAGIGTAAGQVVIAATGTFTAGEATLDIVYRTLDDRASF
jgi:hypothetical protein